MFTTGRYASKKSRDLARRLAKEKKESYISRGKHTIAQLTEMARKKGEENLHIIEERKKEPVKLALIKITETKWQWVNENEL
ncbi:hypothetical protein KKB44_03440 [Candidatus Micrarchaeota archaeon]|nr:hypothetical protein [Candidatus Micrarchaeota archaeon]